MSFLSYFEGTLFSIWVARWIIKTEGNCHAKHSAGSLWKQLQYRYRDLNCIFSLARTARLVAVATEGRESERKQKPRWLGIAASTQEKKLMNSSRLFMTNAMRFVALCHCRFIFYWIQFARSYAPLMMQAQKALCVSICHQKTIKIIFCCRLKRKNINFFGIS